MLGVTKEQIMEAKQWDLLSYLQAHQPGELKRAGPHEYRTVSHDSLVISNGKWHWCSQNIGGKTALDYLIKVCGQDFVSAVQTLCDGRPGPILSQPVKPSSPPTPFELPEPNRYASKSMAYLQERGIDAGIIGRCLRDGSLYESFRYHNCVFVGKDQSGAARFASLRGTYGDFKMDVAGSDKRFNFCLSAASPDCGRVAAFESAIDALSGATLKKLGGEAWEDTHYLALSGTSPLALLQFLQDHPEVSHVALCLDNDEAGQIGAAKIEAAIRNDQALSKQVKTIELNLSPAKYGKDYNQHLQGIQAEKKAHARKERSFAR